jgi:tape measure domain-containing protein
MTWPATDMILALRHMEQVLASGRMTIHEWRPILEHFPTIAKAIACEVGADLVGGGANDDSG